MKQFYDQIPGIWCEVDQNSRYTYVNADYCQLVGVNDMDYLIGKTVADLPCDASECAELFWQEDRLVIDSHHQQRFLNVCRLANNEWKVIQLIKSPVCIAPTQIDRILFNIQVQYDNQMQDVAVKLAKAINAQSPNIIASQMSVTINTMSAQTLAKKEHECLFYLIHGKTYKEIAAIQQVTERTIIDHTERLKFKLGVSKKSELISKAIALGLNQQIPQSLFNKQLSLIL